jgi:lipid II:glycine glycyltransferase (peptidoglycan interpeptide bridge formation enzyme)
MELYNATMLKNNASNFYFFEESYYKNLLKNKSVKLYELLYEEEIIAMGFFMFGESIGHYHLSANTPISYKINANYALLHNVFKIAQDLRLEYFMLGGGTTSEADDSLLKFKKKFSKDLKPFYISGNVYNKEIYDKYNEIWKRQSKEDITYFLKYRLEI